MKDKKTQTKAGTVELSEHELSKTQGGIRTGSGDDMVVVKKKADKGIAVRPVNDGPVY